MTMMLGAIQSQLLMGKRIKNWTLAELFKEGEAGLWLPYQPDHLYADVDKTVPATIGGGIASFDDLSGNGVTGPQSVSTARPILGRVPRTGRRNLLTWTEDLSNPVWFSSQSLDTVIGDTVDGLATVNYVATSTDRRFPRRQLIPVVAASPGKKRYIRARFKLGVGMTTAAVGVTRGTATFAWAAYNTLTATWSNYEVSTIGDIVGISAEEIEPGIWELVAEHTEPAENTPNSAVVHFGTGSASDLRFNSPIGSCEIGFVQCSYTNDPYQRVTTDYDVTEAGVERRNMLTGTAILSSQSVYTRQVEHVLSFYGTGTISLSGTYTGELVGTGANDRVSLTLLPTYGGALKLDVSGDVRKAQLEEV